METPKISFEEIRMGIMILTKNVFQPYFFIIFCQSLIQFDDEEKASNLVQFFSNKTIAFLY